MKEIYNKAEMEIIVFTECDVIQTSGEKFETELLNPTEPKSD